MVANFARGGVAAAVLARSHGIPLHVVHVGVARAVTTPCVAGVTLTRAAVADAGRAAERRITVVVDGFIVSAAILATDLIGGLRVVRFWSTTTRGQWHQAL